HPLVAQDIALLSVRRNGPPGEFARRISNDRPVPPSAYGNLADPGRRLLRVIVLSDQNGLLVRHPDGKLEHGRVLVPVTPALTEPAPIGTVRANGGERRPAPRSAWPAGETINHQRDPRSVRRPSGVPRGAGHPPHLSGVDPHHGRFDRPFGAGLAKESRPVR